MAIEDGFRPTAGVVDVEAEPDTDPAGATCANSFSADTDVATAAGEMSISTVEVGDRVLAWNEAEGKEDYYLVDAVLVYTDAAETELIIAGERIETTPEHPF